jgi:Putative DNA-binding domain
MALALKASAFSIYDDANVRSLTHFLAGDFKVLCHYLGDIAFASMVRDYVIAFPSQFTNQRWYCKELPKFLKSYPPFFRHREILELAILSTALNDAAEAPANHSLTITDFAKLDFEKPLPFKFTLHPSALRLAFTQNTTSIWSALICDEQPPKPHSLDFPQQILVWRQGNTARFRILGEEEVSVLAGLQQGKSYKTVSKIAAKMEGATTAPARVQNYFRGWVEAELVVWPSPNDLALEK